VRSPSNAAAEGPGARWPNGVTGANSYLPSAAGWSGTRAIVARRSVPGAIVTAGYERWAEVHPRLAGTVHVGMTRSSPERVVRNGYWALLAPGRCEPAGWGDMTVDDLRAVARVIGGDCVFVAVAEAAVSVGGPLDWDDEQWARPNPELLADHARWAVVDGQVLRVAPDSPEGALGSVTSRDLAERLVALLSGR
jgi:hypothetical protein